MGQLAFNPIILALLLAVGAGGTAMPSPLPDSAGTSLRPEASQRNISPTYRLVTLPSTNRKRVDAMCLRFLSLIPKAMLIPKTEDRTVYRLVVNTFDRIEPAKKRRAELSHHGISSFIAVDDTGYTVIVGSQFTEALALAEQKDLAGRNIPTTVRELRLPLKEWQMKSNESFAVRDAVSMAARLAKIGVITTLEPAAD